MKIFYKCHLWCYYHNAYSIFLSGCNRISYVIILLIIYQANGQVLKKPVTEKDYHLWGTLFNDKISDKGKWVSFVMHYDDQPDTLFVKCTDSKRSYKFTKATSGLFYKERYFVVQNTDNILSVVDLKKGSIQERQGIMQHSLSNDGRFIISLIRNKGINISTLDGITVKNIANVDNYAINRDGTAIICNGKVKDSVFLTLVKLNTEISNTKIYQSDSTSIQQIVWHDKGNSFAFLEKPKTSDGSNIFFYSITEKKLFQFNAKEYENFPGQNHIENGYANGLTISTDGRKVLFNIRKDALIAKKLNGVQQWNGNDAVTFSERMTFIDDEFNTTLSVWWPKEHRFNVITDEKTPFGILNGSQDFALTYSLMDMKPQYKLVRNVNYYISDLKSGNKKMLLENQSAEVSDSSFSPQGKFFAYFRDGNWWVYEFASGKHINITATSGLKLLNDEDKSWKEIYRIAGWGINDKYLLIYDQFDIWKFDLYGAAPQRLTNGREARISYRIVEPKESEFYRFNFRGHIDLPVDLMQDVLLYGVQQNRTGYFVLKPSGGMKTIVFDNSLNKELIKSKDNEIYVFQSQSYDKPPELEVISAKDKMSRHLFQSNEQHFNYQWGKQEIINYENAKHVPLKGILFYPAGFDASKKYPMIVHIYEKQSYMQHYYINPSLYSMAGFNVADMTAKGYFVFFPDIDYELGDPGISATDCVIAAMKKVLQHEFIDGKKVGLIGHSFGGYETNFIITQTDLFACAISGASVSDLPGWYLSIGWVNGMPEIWRAESQQFRMGMSLFDNRDGYERNSPVTYVHNVNTPLLLWSGENDRQIHYYQSIAFYLALRRLNKIEIMLLYPGDGHALLNKNNQKDLSAKVENWFDYFLKGERNDSWISEGTK
jgi:dipeptidyl aminopeptidase/acylaminoacyl peptidase